MKTWKNDYINRGVYCFQILKNKVFLVSSGYLPMKKEISQLIDFLLELKRRDDNFINEHNQNLFDEARALEKRFQDKDGPYLSGYVYVLKSKNLYKIGRCQDFKNRLRSYKTQNPFGISLIIKKKFTDCETKEKSLLLKFKKKQEKGEWFKLAKIDIEWIRKDFNQN